MDEKNLSPKRSSKVLRRKSTKKSSMKKKNQFSRADQLSQLEMYEKYDQNHPLNQVMRPDEGFVGPKKERQMTDRLCLFFLIVFLGGSVFHGVVLFSYGDINRISNGYDFREEVCGVNGLIKLPYLYYASPSKDINVAFCVESCPITTGSNICLYDIDHFTKTPFCYVQMTSTQNGRYCIPKEPVNRVIVDNHLSETQTYVKRLMSDLYISWDLIIVSMIFLAITAYFFTYLLSFPKIVKFLIWWQIWMSIMCFAALSYLCWREYERMISTRCLYGIDKHYCGGNRATLFQLACWASAGVGLFFLLNIMKLFNKINLAISLIRASAKVVVVLSQLRFFAIFVSIIGFMQFSYSSLVLLYGMTIGERSIVPATNIDGQAVKIYTNLLLYQYTLPYQAFMVLFILLFIMAVNEMFNSYALSVWFFTKKKETVQIPLGVVLRELMLHHLGTCIYAVFMEIFFFIPKWIFYLVRLFLRSLPQESLFVRFMQGCCLCCLAYYQHCLRYLSKHTLVQVAIWSEGYWNSSKKAYFLLSRNQGKIQDLDFLIEFILFLLKISNSLIISIPMYAYLSTAQYTLYGWKIADIESPIIPTLFVFVIGFFYTSVFQVSYDMTTKSVIQLYLVDREMFYGEQRFVESFIQDFMEFYGKSEVAKSRFKSHKQLKYNAQVAPLPKQEQMPSLSDEEEEEEEDEDIDMDDDSEDEPQNIDLGSTNQGKMDPFKQKTQGKVIYADPFELDDKNSQEDNVNNTNRSDFYPPSRKG